MKNSVPAPWGGNGPPPSKRVSRYRWGEMVWSDSGPLTASACTAAAAWPPARTTLRRGRGSSERRRPARPPLDLGARLSDHGPGGDYRPRRADPGRAQEPPPAQALIVVRSSLAVPAGGDGGVLLVVPPVHERPDSTA